MPVQPDQDPLPDSVLASSSYIPADRDLAFLQRDELRPFRLGLELLKPELIQKQEGIRSTIIVFGSARLLEPRMAQKLLDRIETELRDDPGNPTLKQPLALAQRRVTLSHYHDEAREVFETLTLLQTRKASGVVVVLVGRSFWDRLINWQLLVEEGFIDLEDLDLFQYAETAQEAWDLILRRHGAPSAP